MFINEAKNRERSMFCKRANCRWIVSFFVVILIISCFLPYEACAQKDKKVIRVGYYPLEGYQELAENGERTGYGADYLKEIKQYTNWEYEYVDATFPVCLKLLEEGKIDLIGGIKKSEAYEPDLDYSAEECGLGYTALFTKVDSQIAYEDYSAFNGLRVGLLKGRILNEDLPLFEEKKGFSVSKVYYDSMVLLRKALDAGEIDAVLLHTLWDAEGLRAVAHFGRSEFYFAVAKGEDETAAELNQAMAQIKKTVPYFDANLYNKYFGARVETKPVFTKEEQEYIQKQKVIKCAYDAHRKPIEYFDDSKGEYAGIAADFFSVVEMYSGLDFQFEPRVKSTVKSGVFSIDDPDIQVITAVNHDYTWAEKNHFRLSEGYLTIPTAIVTNGYYTEEEKVIGMQREFLPPNQVKEMYPGVKFIYYDSLDHCFQAIKKGNINTILCNYYSALNFTAEPRNAGIYIADTVGASMELTVAVNENEDPLLLSIINKSLQAISEEQKNEIIMVNTKPVGEQQLVDLFYINPIESILAMSIVSILIIILLINIIRIKNNHAKETERLLYFDSMTGAYNKAGFERYAKARIDASQSLNYAIIDFDINHFENYNAFFGYEAGDKLILDISSILRNESDEEEVCARIGADRFVCAWKLCRRDIVERICSFDRSIHETELESSVSLNYGIYLVDDKALPITTMMDRALTAKRYIKGKHDRLTAFYDETLHRRMVEESELLSHIPLAFKKGEFEVFYQPQYNISSGELIGAEALARWRKDDGALLAPASFIKLLEKSGLITTLDFFMLEKVCQKLNQMPAWGIEPVPISVNFSRAHLYDPEFVTTISGVVKAYEVPPELIQIEITESSVSDDSVDLISVINDFHKEGFTVAIDDFGSGLSSLGMLKDIPADVIKLDRSFINDNCKEGIGRYVLQGIFFALNKMDTLVIAEGVETKEQLDFLRQCGCDAVQGYYFSKPMPEHSYITLLKKRERAGES